MTKKVKLNKAILGKKNFASRVEVEYYRRYETMKLNQQLIKDVHEAVGICEGYIPAESIEEELAKYAGSPEAVKAQEKRLKDPQGYKQWVRESSNVILQKFPDAKYIVDKLTEVRFNSRDLKDLKNRIFLSNGESAFKTSGNQSNEESKNDTINGDEQKIADNINDVIVGIKYLLDGI